MHRTYRGEVVRTIHGQNTTCQATFSLGTIACNGSTPYFEVWAEVACPGKNYKTDIYIPYWIGNTMQFRHEPVGYKEEDRLTVKFPTNAKLRTSTAPHLTAFVVETTTGEGGRIHFTMNLRNRDGSNEENFYGKIAPAW